MNEYRELLTVVDTGRQYSKQAGAFSSCFELGRKSILGFGANP
jgi:hypothetical protein